MSGANPGDSGRRQGGIRRGGEGAEEVLCELNVARVVWWTFSGWISGVPRQSEAKATIVLETRHSATLKFSEQRTSLTIPIALAHRLHSPFFVSKTARTR